MAKLALVAGLLAWLVRSGHLDFAALSGAFAHPAWLAAGVAAGGAVVIVASLRWRELLAVQQIALGVRETTRLSLVGSFFSTVMPGGFSGDLVKVFSLAERHPLRKSAVVLSIAADRVMGLAALIFTAAAVLAVRYAAVAADARLQAVAGMIGLLVIGLAAAVPFMFSATVRNHRVTVALLAKLPFSGLVTRLYDALHAFKGAPARVRDATLLSFASALLNALAFYCLGRALGNVTLGLFDYAMVIPLILLATTIPIAPAGIGVGQAAALVMFQHLAGVDKAFGANVMTLYQLGTLVYAGLGAWLFLVQRPKSDALKLERS